MKRVRKQTSDRVSRIAGRVLADLKGAPARSYLVGAYDGVITVGELRALAASALSQDEVRGARKGRRR